MTHKAIASCCNQGIQVTKIDNQGAGSGIDLTALKRHPYSALFSRYDQDEDDRQEMAHSIKNVGLLSPVTMCQNEVLDGWNSLQACKIAGVTPVFEDLAPGLDAWEFVKAKNLLRRHMTPVERVALMAAKVRMDWGEDESEGGCSTLNTLSVRELAEELHVSTGTAHKVQQVLRAGDSEIIDALANRSISLVDAAESAGLPETERPKAVAASKAKAARPHAPRVRVKLPSEVETLQTIIAARESEIRELSAALDEALEEIKIWRQKYDRLECDLKLPKAPASAVTTPISEASVNSKIPAPGLESTVKESGEILDPESCLCFTRALAEGLSPAPVDEVVE